MNRKKLWSFAFLLCFSSLLNKILLIIFFLHLQLQVKPVPYFFSLPLQLRQHVHFLWVIFLVRPNRVVSRTEFLWSQDLPLQSFCLIIFHYPFPFTLSLAVDSLIHSVIVEVVHLIEIVDVESFWIVSIFRFYLFFSQNFIAWWLPFLLQA